ncbi:MAG: DNA polymerase III subunit gamma/tau [Pseudomonadota bacterium]
MTYQVLARKWRPRNFADMVGQSHVLKALSNALDQDRLHHAYLFTGTRGVGKTTLARILAKCLNCESGVTSKPCGVCGACVAIDEGRFVDLIEVDAASRAKVEETRDLMENVQYSPTAGRFKVYLIDEIHMFSNHSFNALLKTLEEPPPHVKFLLATTEPKKLPVTILSRCLQFNLSHLTNDQIAEQIQTILKQEAIEFDQPATELIARGAAGSMRDALSLLDQAIAYGGGALEEKQVRDMLGTIDNADIVGLLDTLHQHDATSLMSQLETIAKQNPDYDALLNEMMSLLQKIAVLQLLPDNDSDDQPLLDLAEKISKEDIQLFYQITMMGKKDLYLAPDAKSGFEMIMIRMLAFRPVQSDEIPNITMPPASGEEDVNQADITKVVRQEKTAVNTVEPEAVVDAKTTKLSIDQGWKNIIDEMALVGLVKELAGHCALKSHSDKKVELSLSPNQEHLLNPNQKARLENAIKTRFGESVKLTIEIEDPENETPAEAKAREERERQKAAEQAVQNDPNVQSLIDTFNATVDKDSIRPS